MLSIVLLWIQYLTNQKLVGVHWLEACSVKVLKLAARFERLIKERQLCESAKEKNEEELLSYLICKYNSFRANSALRKWQITSDGHQAVWCIIIGMTETSRSLLRSHLDHNKWEESGASASFDHMFLFALVICIVWGGAASPCRLQRIDLASQKAYAQQCPQGSVAFLGEAFDSVRPDLSQFFQF